jgi:hypothetical protein
MANASDERKPWKKRSRGRKEAVEITVEHSWYSYREASAMRL